MTDVQKIREYRIFFVVETTDLQTEKIWITEGIKKDLILMISV